MTPELPPPNAAPELRLMNNARRVRDTGLAILVWIVLIGVFFWGLAHIAGPVLMFALGAILAYALTPLVGRLRACHATLTGAYHRLYWPARGDRGGAFPASRHGVSGGRPARRR